MENAERDVTPVAGSRRAALPGGRRLDVRPVGPADVDGLAALYAGLTVEDLYRRFFSVYRPDRAFFARVASVADRGGCGLVAVEYGDGADDGDGVVVAEAGYELLRNGDGELAITVADAWRGWLGPFLLDALVEAAAARGVPNLEADILVSNAPMLALVRSRGYVTLADSEWCSVRVVIGTAGRVPTWPGAHDRPRVLVEVPGGRWHAGVAAEAAGLQVLACPGPLGARTRCPALIGRPCPLAASADAVVMSHGAPDERWDALLAAHRRVHPGVPVCVEEPAGGGTDVEAGAGADGQVTHLALGEPEEAVLAAVRRLAAPSSPTEEDRDA